MINPIKNTALIVGQTWTDLDMPGAESGAYEE